MVSWADCAVAVITALDCSFLAFLGRLNTARLRLFDDWFDRGTSSLCLAFGSSSIFTTRSTSKSS